MLARVQSCAVLGIDAYPLAVEVDIRPGENKIKMVGLPDTAVKESEDRVSSALRNSGFRVPRGVVIVNLAPADMRKQGSALDLPIAAGMLAASGQLNGQRLNEYALVGELALDGSVRSVPGALSMAIAARDLGLRGIVLPAENADEAGVVDSIEIIPVARLNDAHAFLSGQLDLMPRRTDVEAAFAAAKRSRASSR